jgi:hypothetical protein
MMGERDLSDGVEVAKIKNYFTPADFWTSEKILLYIFPPFSTVRLLVSPTFLARHICKGDSLAIFFVACVLLYLSEPGLNGV